MHAFDGDRWERIDALLDGALDLPEEERSGYLDRECGEDAELRRQVEKLLAAGRDAGTFLEANTPSQLVAMREAVRTGAEEDESMAGERVGPYRIIRRIGKGGMGQVFLAVRDDQSYTRYVALKIIRRGMDTDEILQRFEVERRILASLSHPNIARLLDGGATDSGVSYFVMEYIDGVPITEYCDTNRLGVRQRLTIFRKVASAVHYAHQNLIVHRDLKPSNILVTADAEPRLLDFGIAKFLNPNLAGYTMPMTRTEMRVMTPEYASPEQMRGETVTTASDVYQLGVLLYELLTGLRPHATAGRTRKEIERLVLETDPERPSTAIGHADPERLRARTGVRPTSDSASRATSGTAFDRLKRTLSGDLDRIVLMALRKETDRRYQSADQLQQDVERYLSGHPVTAQKDTWSYRASKFVRRHRVGVAMGAALTVLLLAVTIMSVRFAVVTSQQSEQIALAAAETEEVRQFLISLFQVSNPELARGRQITARELLDQGVDRIDTQLSGQPEVQASLLNVMGVVNVQLGEYDEAEPLLARALAIRRSLHGESDSRVAESLFEMAMLRDWQGDYDESERLHRDALEIRQAELGARDEAVALSLSSLAAVIAYQGRIEESESLLQESLGILDEVYEGDQRHKTEVLSNLGWVLHEEGKYEEAEAMYRRALAMQRRVLGGDHPYFASTTNNLAALLYDTERFDEAEPLFRDVLRLRRTIYGEEHTQVANSIGWLGRVIERNGRPDEAEPLLREALQRHREQLGEQHFSVARDRHVLASLLLARASEQRAAGEEPAGFAEAEQLLIDAIGVYRAVLDDPEDRLIAAAQGDLSALYEAWGRPDRSAMY